MPFQPFSCKPCVFPNRKAILQDGTGEWLNKSSAAFFVEALVVNRYICRQIPQLRFFCRVCCCCVYVVRSVRNTTITFYTVYAPHGISFARSLTLSGGRSAPLPKAIDIVRETMTGKTVIVKFLLFLIVGDFTIKK
jgi:hypothetical protein